MLSRLLGWIVTFAMLFLLFDGVLRLVGCGPKPPVVEFHEELGWAKKQGTSVTRDTSEFEVTYDLNSKGLRGPEAEYLKAPGTRRVLFVGDSFVQGFAVPDHDLFLRVLERDLNAAGEKVECLNGGTEGYATDQEFLWFQGEGSKYSPDVVVLAPFDNDVYWCGRDFYTDRAKPYFKLEGEALALMDGHVTRPASEAWWKGHTAIGNVVKNFQKGLLAGRDFLSLPGGKVFGEQAVVFRDEPPEVREAWRVVDKLLHEFARTAKDAGSRLVLLSIPSREEIHGDVAGTFSKFPADAIDFSQARRRYAQLAAAAGFHVVDPTAALKAEAERTGERLYFEKDFHWNERGNAVVAQVLKDAFAQTGVVAATAAAAPPAEPFVPHDEGGVPTWAYVVGAIWVLLSLLYWRSYPRDNVAAVFLKVGALVAVVTGVFLGVGRLAGGLPPSLGKWVFPLIVGGLLLFILVKIGKQLGVILELYGTMLRRGHWYMLPMLVVMLSIGMLLVVAASSPFVAPFIYTLF